MAQTDSVSYYDNCLATDSTIQLSKSSYALKHATPYQFTPTDCPQYADRCRYFSLLTDYLVDVEVHTPNGRVDIVMLSRTNLYLIEIKMNKDAHSAMQQINLNDYARRFALCGKPIVKVGVNFDAKKGSIEDWMIEE